MMRLARCSGIIGLAGMAFVSHFYSRRPTSKNRTGLLLVRPLLQFSKQDLYAVCPIILPCFCSGIGDNLECAESKYDYYVDYYVPY